MHKRSFFLGLGAGLLILSSVTLLTMGFNKKPAEAPLSVDDIERAARDLGMIYYNELPSKSAADVQNNSSSNESYPATEPQKSNEDETVKGLYVPSDKAIVERARALGMIFSNEVEQQENDAAEAPDNSDDSNEPDSSIATGTNLR